MFLPLLHRYFHSVLYSFFHTPFKCSFHLATLLGNSFASLVENVNGKNKREWLYVKDCVKTILNIVNSKTNEGIFNIGSKNLISNIDLISIICEIYFNKKFTKKEILNNFVNFVNDRPGHDFMYKLNLEKINKNKFLVNSNFRINLKNTVDHFKNTL